MAVMNLQRSKNQSLVFAGLVICGLWAGVFLTYMF